MNERQERIYQARRAGLVARLHDAGFTRARAEQAVAAWEAEGERRGLERLSPEYWREAPQWIDGEGPTTLRPPG